MSRELQRLIDAELDRLAPKSARIGQRISWAAARREAVRAIAVTVHHFYAARIADRLLTDDCSDDIA